MVTWRWPLCDCWIAALVLAGTLLGEGPATAEVVLSAYGGGTITSATDVHYARGDDTDLDFAGVEWRSEPFTSPIYYGLRLGYWLGDRDRWGLALDFTHDKLFAKTERVVIVSGRRQGIRVDERERLGDTFSTLSFSHGHNLIVGGLIRRWRRDAGEGEDWRQHVAPYAGGGVGFTVPHVEVTVGEDAVDEYQLSGPVFAALAGLEVEIGARVRLLAEYRATYARLVGELTDAGQIEIWPWTHHLVAGLSYVFLGP